MAKEERGENKREGEGEVEREREEGGIVGWKGS